MVDRKLSGFAIITGASSGIGFELTRLLAADGCAMLLVADEPLAEAAAMARAAGAPEVATLEVDLGTQAGLAEVLAAAAGRKVDILIANAATGHGGRFLGQDWALVRHIIDTNVTYTVQLVHAIARQMSEGDANADGRILITGSIVADMPGTFNLAYNSTKSFVVKFCAGLSEELASSGISVTCLLPGAVDTPFFARAGMTDTPVGRLPKYSAQSVARTGYRALLERRRKIVSGLLAKLQYGVADILPDAAVAKLHRIMAHPARR